MPALRPNPIRARLVRPICQLGPKTLRGQVAIVSVEQSMPALEALSFIPVPVGVPGGKFGLLKAKELGTGKPVFVGEAVVEAKFTDAHTGEVLFAAVDRRVGGRRPGTEVFDSWDDVHQAFRYWAEKVRYRLCQQRGGSQSVPPNA